MIVLVTGINSGLGSALIPKLQSEPSIEKIIGIDLNEYTGSPEKIEFIKMDVRDKDGIEHALQGVDVVIHLAFIVFPKKFPKLKIIYDINVNGSKTVFRAAAKNNVKKIIYTSSQSVYGHLEECPEIVNEEAQRLGSKTTNMYYSHTKALVEAYLDKFEKTYPNIAVVRFRPPVIAGKNFLRNLGILSPKKGKTMFLPQIFNRNQGIQLVHQDDLTDAIIIALKKDVHGTYNISSNILPDLARFAEEEYGAKVIRIPIPTFLVKIIIGLGRIWTLLRWLQALLYNSLMNTEKIERELGWKPKYSTEDCLREMINGK